MPAGLHLTSYRNRNVWPAHRGKGQLMLVLYSHKHPTYPWNAGESSTVGRLTACRLVLRQHDATPECHPVLYNGLRQNCSPLSPLPAWAVSLLPRSALPVKRPYTMDSSPKKLVSKVESPSCGDG